MHKLHFDNRAITKLSSGSFGLALVARSILCTLQDGIDHICIARSILGTSINGIKKKNHFCRKEEIPKEEDEK